MTPLTHQGIANQTPRERYQNLPARPAPLRVDRSQPTYPPHSIVRAVAPNGVFAFRANHINIGRRYAGARVRIVETGELVHVYYGDELIRTLAPNPDRRYQRLGRQRRKETIKT